MQEMDRIQTLTEILFDDKNMSVVELVSPFGKRLKVEQVFATTYEGTEYCILAPINEVHGIKPGTGLVFCIKHDYLFLVDNEEMNTKIFNMYYERRRMNE